MFNAWGMVTLQARARSFDGRGSGEGSWKGAALQLADIKVSADH